MGRVIRERIVAGPTVLTQIKMNSPRPGKRRAKSNPTSEAVQKNNDRIAERNLTAILNANFRPGDWHITLTYAEALPLEQEKKELKNFLARMRREFKKAGKEFRYVVVTEYLNKRPHHHIVMNHIDLQTIYKQWRFGRIHNTPLERNGNYNVLAAYLIKETSKTFRLGENAMKKRWCASKNLERPIVVREVMSSEALFDKPRAIKGYSIDPDTINYYKHPFTQMEHLEYIQISTDPIPRIKKLRGKTVKGESFARFETIRQLELEDFDNYEWRTL